MLLKNKGFYAKTGSPDPGSQSGKTSTNYDKLIIRQMFFFPFLKTL
jgi:hypothetical protein